MPVTNYSKEFRANLLVKFNEYIDETLCPYGDEFMLNEKVPDSTFYSFGEFSDSLKRCMQVRELYFIDKLVTNKGNVAAWVFLLKCQHNYREQTPVQVNTGDTKQITINLLGKRIDELQDIATKQLRQAKAGRVSKVHK